MDDQKSILLKLINASGFLFQLSVENRIKELHKNREIIWDVHSNEFPWIDPVSGKEYFIDLILREQSETQRMVVECKRVKNGTWIFLSNKKLMSQHRAKLLWTNKKTKENDKSDWDYFSVSPHSPQSSICIIRGQGEKDKPMLERLSGFVLRATETLANDELILTRPRVSGRLRFYVPIIITNAVLQVCYLEVDEIDIASGTIDDAEFEEVPFIRFRKNLSTTIKTLKPTKDLKDFSYHHDRTILVVNSNSLDIFFREFSFSKLGFTDPWE